MGVTVWLEDLRDSRRGHSHTRSTDESLEQVGPRSSETGQSWRGSRTENIFNDRGPWKHNKKESDKVKLWGEEGWGELWGTETCYSSKHGTPWAEPQPGRGRGSAGKCTSGGGGRHALFLMASTPTFSAQ